MSALDLLTVLCGLLALAAAGVLSVVSARMLRATRELEAARAEFEAQAVPALIDLRHAVDRATDQVDRVEDLVEVAGAIGERVDAATDITYRALTSPVIKTVALASGTRRAARRLRGTDDDGHPPRDRR
jgi:hypothetical protein